FQLFPTAAIDRTTGDILVAYYDNRRGGLNRFGHYLLDWMYTVSIDGGLSFGPEGQVNDLAFDPDANAPVYDVTPPATFRIGEYNGLVAAGCVAGTVWCGNTLDTHGVPSGQQSVFDLLGGRRLPRGTVGNGLRAVRR